MTVLMMILLPVRRVHYPAVGFTRKVTVTAHHFKRKAIDAV
ncbi:hypothetical protein ABT185_16480 [Streptomyces clavifer]